MFAPFMLGAQSRLLPPSVPFSFFGFAVVFHIAGWAVLLYGADQVSAFMGGAGPALAALHLITLGVLTMAAMGASYQLLPVATKRPVRSVAACRASLWLYAPGVALLAYGFAGWRLWAMHAGGAMAVLGLAIFAALIGDNLRRVEDMPLVTRHAWMALGSLVALAGLGMALLVDFTGGFLGDRQSVAALHAVIAGYGFMGMLIIGFSYVLLPMFTLSEAPRDRTATLSVALVGTALLLVMAGALFGQGALMAAGGAAGLGAAGLHLRDMAVVMHKRMKRRLDSSFLLIRAAWVALPLSIIVGIALALGFKPLVTAPLFGFLLVFGWLLTFLAGVLQRIMPFLASMHSARKGGRPVLVSALTASMPLKLHVWCHLAAIAGIAGGIVLDQAMLVRVGALAGLIGAIAFAIFVALLWRRLILHFKITSEVIAEKRT